MSFQAYLDNIEQKTGKTPQQLLDIAQSKGFDADDSDTLRLDGIKNR